MEKPVKVILLLFFIFFAILFIWATYRPVYDNFFLSYSCSEEKRMKELSINGIIKRKYIDSAEHGFRTLSILIDRKTTYNFHVFYGQDSILWLKTKVNDSVSKQLNTTRFFIYRNCIVDTLDIYYPCNNR